MRTLSKSKLIAHRQCPKRLWLELHRPELREDSAQSAATFSTGHSIGAIAQALYDPRPDRAIINSQGADFNTAFENTLELLHGKQPFFEAGFRAGGVLAFADVMLPLGRGAWKMVEVKSSASIKDYQFDDVAIQHFVATQSGVKLKSLALAHVNSKWVYPGAGDYRGLLVETDVTVEAASTFGWERYIGEEGVAIGMTTFGASAPFKDLQKYFGFTPDRVVEEAKNLLGS